MFGPPKIADRKEHHEVKLRLIALLGAVLMLVAAWGDGQTPPATAGEDAAAGADVGWGGGSGAGAAPGESSPPAGTR